MAEYHVGTSPITGVIYAGTIKKAHPKGGWTEWEDKTDVTQEAIDSVMAHMYMLCEENKGNKASYKANLKSGKQITLTFEMAEE